LQDPCGKGAQFERIVVRLLALQIVVFAVATFLPVTP
jgi:hypothetical protein